MRTFRRVKSLVAALVLGALAFAQASVSLAACSMERGNVGQVIAAQASAPCDCGTMATEFGPLYANRCLAHCTADLQLSSMAAAIADSGAQAPVLLLPRARLQAGHSTGLQAPPLGTPPTRILLHSFLI
jgi:hypothetical protein